MSYTTDKTFNFNDWLKENKLLKYKNVFIDCKMTNLASLDVNNSSFATLITDIRLNGNESIVQNIVKSIQSLHYKQKSTNTDALKIKMNQLPHKHSEQTNKLIKEQHFQLNKLIITQNKNKQKYNKYFSQNNENKLKDYIKKIAITKTNISKSFEILRQSINNEEKRILNETLKQETNALLIQSNMNNNKQNGYPMQNILNSNDLLIKKFENTLQLSNNNVNNLNCEYLKNECNKIFSDVQKNNENIENTLSECDYCKLSMPQINQVIYNKISENLYKMTNFNHCCPIKINITNINFINANSIRIVFNILPQRHFKQCQVLYNFNNIKNGFKSDENGRNDEQKTECVNFHQTTKITSLLYKENNENSMIVELNCKHNNHLYCKYLNVKIRFRLICDEEWSSYSTIYSIVNQILPESEKIKNIFYVSSDSHINRKGLYIANNNSNQSIGCNIFELNSPNVLTTRHKEKWLIKDAGICYGENILLPDIIGQNVCEIYNNNYSKTMFNCLFKCGGTIRDTIATKYCSAIIFDDFNNFDTEDICISEMSQYISTPTIDSEISKSKTFLLNWELPLFPKQTDCNDITYSQYYGLLSCGGWEFHYNSNKFYRLPFNNESYFDQNKWQWNIMPSMNIKRSWPTLLMLDDMHKLIVIGGKGPINSVEMFNFKTNKWINLHNLNHARCSAGVVYDKLTQNIFIGGGFNALNKIEKYDLYKNKWYNDLPDTKKSHASYPILWLGDNGNLLYIASIYSNSMEYCDLRIKTNKYWNCVYGKSYNQLWQNVFGTKFAKINNCRLCLS